VVFLRRPDEKQQHICELMSCNICLRISITITSFFSFCNNCIILEETWGSNTEEATLCIYETHFSTSPKLCIPAYVSSKPRQATHYCLERNFWIQILRIYWHKFEPNPKYSYNNPSLLSKSLRFPPLFCGQQVTKIGRMCIRTSSLLFSPLHSAAASAADIFESK